MAFWEELRNKQDPEPPQHPEVLGDDVPLSSNERSNNGTGPPMISRGISAGEYSSSEDEEQDFGSNKESSEESNNDSVPLTTILRGSSADEYSSSKDERSNNGTGPPMISCGISDMESGSHCSEDDEDLMFCGYGQGEPIAAIRPARLSETSELTDDDVGEEVVV
jgi:hypothetical protein